MCRSVVRQHRTQQQTVESISGCTRKRRPVTNPRNSTVTHALGVLGRACVGRLRPRCYARMYSIVESFLPHGLDGHLWNANHLGIPEPGDMFRCCNADNETIFDVTIKAIAPARPDGPLRVGDEIMSFKLD